MDQYPIQSLQHLVEYKIKPFSIAITTSAWDSATWPAHRITGLPLSMPNADKCRSKFWHWSQCRSIPIDSSQLIGIDRHWSAMIGIERHFGSMPWFWSALVGIDQHWTLIEGVLRISVHTSSKESNKKWICHSFPQPLTECIKIPESSQASDKNWNSPFLYSYNCVLCYQLAQEVFTRICLSYLHYQENPLLYRSVYFVFWIKCVFLHSKNQILIQAIFTT